VPLSVVARSRKTNKMDDIIGKDVDSSRVEPTPSVPLQEPQRRFSQMMRDTSKKIEYAVEDISQFLDLQSKVEHVVEESKREGSEGGRKELQRGESLKKMLNPESIMLRDKIAFFLGVANVALIGYLMGKCPEEYYHYWTLKSIVLFTMRWYKCKKIGYQYLMFELCYFGNILGIVHVYLFPGYILMRRLAFSICAGPLMWSILAMNNALVFHDIDKVTTLMMHASPALTAWSLRWYPDERWLSTVLDVSEYAKPDVFQLVVIPIVFYLAWVVMYYFLTFVLLKEQIRKRGGVTMFELMVPKDTAKARKSPIAKFVLSVPEAWQPILYLCCHAFAALVSFLPTYLFWQYFWLHTMALLFCLALSIWNGGNYYFKVFAKRYLQQLEERSHHGKKA